MPHPDTNRSAAGPWAHPPKSKPKREPVYTGFLAGFVAASATIAFLIWSIR